MMLSLGYYLAFYVEISLFEAIILLAFGVSAISFGLASIKD